MNLEYPTTSHRENTDTSVELDSFAFVMSNIVRKSNKKLADDLLQLLAHPEFDLRKVLNPYSNIRHCHQHVDSFVDKNFRSEGFNPVEFRDEKSELKYMSYRRHPVEVLQQQVSMVDANSCFFDCLSQTRDGEPVSSHPMPPVL